MIVNNCKDDFDDWMKVLMVKEPAHLEPPADHTLTGSSPACNRKTSQMQAISKLVKCKQAQNKSNASKRKTSKMQASAKLVKCKQAQN